VDEQYKRKEKEKLFATTKKIGYPDKWKDYSTIAISRNAYFENLVSASGDAYQRELAKLGKPVDKSEWFTTPSTVTAYNNPSANEIVFQQVFYSLPILIMRPMTLLTMEVSEW
jgi:putative endopeptidase